MARTPSRDPYRRAVPEDVLIPASAAGPPSPAPDGVRIRLANAMADEAITFQWKDGTTFRPATRLEGQQRLQQQEEAGRQLAKLWCSAYEPKSPSEILNAYFLSPGRDRLGAVYDAVHPLPWSVLRPLQALPAWTPWPGSVEAPVMVESDDAAQRIRQLPEEIERWRTLHRHLAAASAVFYDLFQRARDAAEPMGEPDRFLCELGDDILTELTAGTRPSRLTGVGKSDGKAQNLVRLRVVALQLALRINRAMPQSRTDGRLMHGVLRTRVRRKMLAIIHAVYGVTFTDSEAKDMIHKHVKENTKLPK